MRVCNIHKEKVPTVPTHSAVTHTTAVSRIFAHKAAVLEVEEQRGLDPKSIIRPGWAVAPAIAAQYSSGAAAESMEFSTGGQTHTAASHWRSAVASQ